jgi:PleD family two-component response regulator
MQLNKRKILAAVEDLFFVVKINDMAKRNGFDVEFLKNEKDLLAKAKADPPSLVIVDLNNNGSKPVSMISKLKSDESTRPITVIGFVSHVNGELKQQAQDAGANMVMARSAFSTNLPQILKRHAGSLA